MKILVAVKRVVDHNVKIRVKSDGSGVETDNVRFSMNPFCKHALEGAVQIKEQGKADEIIVVSIGSKKANDVLLTALAMGADRAIHILVHEKVEPLAVAKLLQKIVQEEKPELVLMGKQAVDNDANQSAQMLAGLLDWGQATFAASIELNGQVLEVMREVDYGRKFVRLNLPAVISADLALNKPRNVALPMVMKAKRKPLIVREVNEFDVDIKPRLEVIKTVAPPTRAAGKTINSVDELLVEIKHLTSNLEVI